MASTNTTAFVVTAVVAALLGAAYSSGIVTVAAVIVKEADWEAVFLAAVFLACAISGIFQALEASQAHSQAHNGHNRQGAAVLSAGPSQSGPSTGAKYISQTRAFSHGNGYLNQDNLWQTAELSPSGVRLTKIVSSTKYRMHGNVEETIIRTEELTTAEMMRRLHNSSQNHIIFN